MGDSRQLLKSLEQAVFEFPALIIVELLRVSEAWNKVVKDLFGSCFAKLVSGWIGLCKAGKVVYKD